MRKDPCTCCEDYGCVGATVLAETRIASFSKCGFPQNNPPSTGPQKVYLLRTETFSAHGDHDGSGPDFNCPGNTAIDTVTYTGHYTLTTTIILKSKGIDKTTFSANGTATQVSHALDWIDVECSDTADVTLHKESKIDLGTHVSQVPGCSTDAPYTEHETGADGPAGFVGGSVGTPSISPTTITDSRVDSPGYDTFSSTDTITLSSEFTTGQLESIVDAILADAEWAEGSASTSRSLSSTEQTMMKQALRYRFQLGGIPPSCKAKVKWKERFYPAGGGAATSENAKEVEKEWTGSPCFPEDYDPSDSSTLPIVGDSGGEGWFTLDPGDADGEWQIEDVEVECLP